MENEAPQVISFDEYCWNRGVPQVLGAADLSFIKSAAGLSTRGLRQAQERVRIACTTAMVNRAVLRREYDTLVKEGSIRDYTYEERLIMRCRGREDHESTHAARRLADKKNIQWKEIEK